MSAGQQGEGRKPGEPGPLVFDFLGKQGVL